MRNISLTSKYRFSAMIALSAILLTSCGATSYKETALNSTGSSQTASNSVSASPTPTPTSTSTDDSANYPAYSSSFTLTGSSGSSPSYSYTVTTDNLLKVKITPGAATNVIPGSNFSATYECVSYSVTALGQTISTGTLSVTGGNSICPSAPTSKTLDFSSRLTSGHQSVTVTVKATGYDFYCQGCLSYPWLYNAYPYGYYSCNMYCPLHTVYQNHGVTGTMAIQVNGTSL